MSSLDPVRGPGSNVNQHTREGSRRRSRGVAEAPHGTHLACQVRSGQGITGRVEHFSPADRKTLARFPIATTPKAGRFRDRVEAQ